MVVETQAGVNAPEETAGPEPVPGISDAEAELKLLGDLMDVTVDVKEVMSSFALITYDIPSTEEGNKARSEFLIASKRAGIVQHTESVYYGPWSMDYNFLIVDLEQIAGSTVYVWKTDIADPNMAMALTRHYDTTVLKWMDEFDGRLDTMLDHLAAGKHGIAVRMFKRTGEMVNELDKTCKRRESTILTAEFEKLKLRMVQVMAQLI
jgi:hypothetical protein